MARTLAVLVLALGCVLLGPSGSVAAADAGASPRARSAAVVETWVLGYSTRGRPIKAWRLGEPGRKKVVLVATMHGNEPHVRRILTSLRDGRPIRGVDLWVIPTYNPDGLAARTRKNARGVDLNRNFPSSWRDLDGSYESGARAGSERETRAVMRFLRWVDPRRVISFHQPLYGVDTDTKDPRFAGRLARHLDLPRRSFTCGGVCHGTMTGWFNANFSGSALTVEYASRPSRHRMQVQAPGQLLAALGARRPR